MKIKKLGYFLDINKKVKKFINKLDKISKKNVYLKIYNLQKNPVPKKKKHILSTNKNKFLCELCVDKLRFYYVLIGGRILIDDVEYLGKIDVEKAFSNHKSGNKKNNPNQQKDINLLKKWFRKIFGK